MFPNMFLGETFLDFQTTVLFVFIAILLIIAWYLRRTKNLPPGPWGWPFVGYLPNAALSSYWTGLAPYELLANIACKYGSVFSMYVGGTLVVVLDKYDVVKEAFHNLHLNDKPDIALLKDVGMGEGLVQASGESWKQRRRFTLTTLRSFGVGTKSFEENITEEAKLLSQEITHLQGKPFNPKCILTSATANLICCVVFGQRFEYQDASFRFLLDSIQESLKLVGSGGLQLVFPFAKYLQPTIYTRLVKNAQKIKQFVMKTIEDHQKVHDPENLRDYIDVCLNEMKLAKKQNLESFIDNASLITAISDLFVAGTDSTATTLCWAILYMITYPEIQTRIQLELDSVVGRNRLPKLADKSQLPFTWATLLEVQRAASISPLGAVHYSGEDTTLAGYRIPKGSMVVSNLWSVHHDTGLWGNPDDFVPERFIDEDGNVKERAELIPFSIGRRVCIGEHLAKMELFIFFSHLLHQFTFTNADESTKPSLKGINGVVLSPQPFFTRISVRE